MRHTSRLRRLALVVMGLILVLALSVGSGQASAASSGMRISGTTDQGTRLDNIEILSWSHAVISVREAGSGIATGRRQYQPLLIRKRIDKSTPLLMKAMGQNETFPTLRIAIDEVGMPGSGGRPSAMTITLTNAQIVSIATGEDDDCDGVCTVETVSFVATRIEWSADGATYADDWSLTNESSPPTYFMAINEKGVPTKPKKQVKAAAYRTQIVSPRDPASGLPTGKRQHSPLLLVMPDSSQTPELLDSFLTGRPIGLVSVITYGPDGAATGAINLEGVHVVAMTETRRTLVIPHVLESSGQAVNPLYEEGGLSGTNPLYEASLTDTGSDVVFELTYNKIKWLDASGGVTHEDTWDSQR